ncbi:MAG: serine/threonine-protein kinase [Rhizobacter sp.]
MPPANHNLAPTIAFVRSGSSAPDEFDGRDALPVGTRLAEFELLCVLGTGGFGIVYLALDHALRRQVAIKEYMPSSLAVRGAGSWVALRAPQHAGTFAAGLRSFVNEAQLLASFDHPSLVKVHRFWEEHGTAYMVMQYYPGRTLKQERCEMEQAPTEVWLQALVVPLLDALDVLHREGVYHRDVSPDNVLLQVDGPPVLLDFGAARKVIGDHSQRLTAILKPSFAPIEQYADMAGMRQGPWTDLYAVAAVVYYMRHARPPVPAVARAVRDSQRPLAEEPGNTGSAFFQAIDWALAVAPEARPQNVSQMRDALAGRLKRPEPTSRPTAPAAPSNRRPRWTWATGMALGLFAVTAAGWSYRTNTAPARDGLATASAVIAIPAAAVDLPRPAVSRPPVNSKSPAAPAQRAAAVAKSTAGGPKSPDEACGGRNFFSKAICISRECASPRFRQHPQCVAQRQRNETNQHNQSG